MKTTVYILIAGLLAAGCATSLSPENGQGLSEATSSFRLMGVPAPQNPIQDAIKLALGVEKHHGNVKDSRDPGPNLTSGKKLTGRENSTSPETAQAAAQPAQATTIEFSKRSRTRLPEPCGGQAFSTTSAPRASPPDTPPHGVERSRLFIPPYSGYRLQVGDVVDIVVSGDPDLSGRVIIRQDGKLALPSVLVLVKAAGRTVRELTENIRTSLHGAYLKQLPNISVEIIEGSGFSVTGVIGNRNFIRIPLGRERPYQKGSTPSSRLGNPTSFIPARTLKPILITLLSKIERLEEYDLGKVTIIESSRTYTVDARAVFKKSRQGRYLPPGTVIMIPLVSTKEAPKEIAREPNREHQGQEGSTSPCQEDSTPPNQPGPKDTPRAGPSPDTKRPRTILSHAKAGNALAERPDIIIRAENARLRDVTTDNGKGL